MSKIFTCIIGKSGSGKTSIVEELNKKYGLTSIPSYTTREPRFKGEEGHVFISNDTFELLKDDIAAYANIYGKHYFATNSQIDEYDTYVVDYVGYMDLLKNYKGSKKIISVYVTADKETRAKRMVDQNRTMSDILDRLGKDDDVFEGVKDRCDYIVFNHDGELNTAVDLIMDIIEDEKCQSDN